MTSKLKFKTDALKYELHNLMFVDPPPILALVPCILACRGDTFCGAHTF
jgi:hypothetical protein